MIKENYNFIITNNPVLALAPEQERLESWIMGEVEKGAALPGLYPPNAENKARYEASRGKR